MQPTTLASNSSISPITTTEPPTELHCNDAFECVYQIVSYPIKYINGNGYKSITGWNTSLSFSDWIRCDGAYSCTEISQIVGGQIDCDGSNACFNNRIMHSDSGIFCDGSNSCAFSTLITPTVRCNAEKSCASSTISNASYITGHGAYSLINATIYSVASFRIVLTGYYAGFKAKLICAMNDECTISCYANGCYMFYIDCKGICSIDANSMFTINPLMNVSYDEWMNTITSINESILIYDSQILTLDNDNDCNNRNMTFDDYQSFINSNRSEIYSDDSICCRGDRSCRYEYSGSGVVPIKIYPRKHVENIIKNVICSGFYACRYANIDNVMGSIYCSGADSCMSTVMNTTKDIYCFGEDGCMESTIYNAQNVFCSGRDGCQNAVFLSSGSGTIHSFYGLGLQGLAGAIIHCKENDECDIFCGGYSSCSGASVICEGKCVVECDDDTQCPFVIQTNDGNTDTTTTTTTTTTSIEPTTLIISSNIISNVTNLYPLSDDDDDNAHSESMIFGLILAISIVILPIIISYFAHQFHGKRLGSDHPHYVSLFKFFAVIADFYTDLVWSLHLYEAKEDVWVYAFVFVSVSHVISIVICLLFIIKWSQYHGRLDIKQYVQKYDKLMFCLTVFCGFYATTELITSHLFHLNVLSLTIRRKDREYIDNLKLFNEYLVENIPCFLIQIYLLSSPSRSRDFWTILAFTFTVLSIMRGLLLILERLINRVLLLRIQLQTLHEVHIIFTLESPDIQSYHTHCHDLLSRALQTALVVEEYQVEITRIQKTTKGIKVTAIISALDDERANNIRVALSDDDDLMFHNLHNDCVDCLQLADTHTDTDTHTILQILDIWINSDERLSFNHKSKYEKVMSNIQMNSIAVANSKTQSF